ncbi:hypothetical protein Daus18300_011562 [Diaporthe australafricana]|uniref:HET domain-containing protein n=1 Tax=Diaporthe australafricana TaxID=127596 RepID=A0ABR3W6B0_9PEZI
MGKARLLRDPREFGRGISWESIVAEYTEREIRHEKDRLPALAGLAARFGQVSGYTYLAGMWLEEMPSLLLWEKCYDDGPSPTHFQTAPSWNWGASSGRNHTAPSWSWASLNRPAFYLHHYFERTVTPRASISSSYCQHQLSGSFSSVENAWIDVEGHIKNVTNQKRDLFYPEHYMSTCQVVAGNEWWYSGPDHGSGYPKDEIAKGNVYLLVLGWSRYYESRPAYVGLVLQESGHEDGRPCFQRLGIAYSQHASEKSQLQDESPIRDLHPSWELRVVRLV